MVLPPPENSKYQTTLAFEVIWWALQSGQVSLKSVRWHVSPLPGPLMDMLIILLSMFSFRMALFSGTDLKCPYSAGQN